MSVIEELDSLLSRRATEDEIIDLICKVGPGGDYSNTVDWILYEYLEGRLDALVWRILHGSDEIAYGAAFYIARFYDLQDVFYRHFDLAKARERLEDFGWFV